MDLDKCKILLIAVDSGSLSAAASRLGYTTAGVSYNVDAVENELGFPIIRRGHAGITLTQNGKKVVPILRELIQVGNRLERQAQEIRLLQNGEVTIGTFSSIAIHLMPAILSSFQKEYPGVGIEIREGVQQELEAMLAKNEVDFCLCSYQKKNKFRWIPLRKDPMMCVIPQGHPLADQEAVAPSALSGVPLIVPAYGKDPDVIELLARFDVTPNIKYTTVETDTAFAMVNHGFGVLITNALTMQDRVKDAVVRPFEPAQYITEGIYIQSADASPVALRMVRFLQDYFSREEK